MLKKIFFAYLFCILFLSITVINSFSQDVVRFNYPQYRGVAWDWCLYWAKDCGKPAADDFCRQKGYSHSANYKWAYMNQTYVVRAGKICKGKCGGFTYVDCAKNRRGLSYEECLNRFCPECSKSVNLLGQSADAKCQACMSRNKANIDSCMKGYIK